MCRFSESDSGLAFLYKLGENLAHISLHLQLGVDIYSVNLGSQRVHTFSLSVSLSLSLTHTHLILGARHVLDGRNAYVKFFPVSAGAPRGCRPGLLPGRDDGSGTAGPTRHAAAGDGQRVGDF